MKKQKILLIGPFPSPISGVSIANLKVKEILLNDDFYSVNIIDTSFPEFGENIGEFSFKKLLFSIVINFKIFKIFYSDIVYITPGQTFFGVLKYSFFILYSKILKKELIIHVHGNHLATEYKLLKGFKKKIFFYLISCFNKGIVLSESLKSNLVPFLNSESIFILNNFASDSFNLKDKVVDVKKLKILFLSNLMEEKGILYFLDALFELDKENINYEAKLAGNISKELNSIILTKLEKLPKVEYLGVVQGDAKQEILNWSNVFILPTYYKMEGQPISILEAMASKNIIITTKHAGIPDVVIDNKNGFFVEKKSSISISQKLIFLSNKKELISTMAEYNNKYFSSNYSLRIFKSRILNIFKS